MKQSASQAVSYLSQMRNAQELTNQQSSNYVPSVVTEHPKDVHNFVSSYIQKYFQSTLELNYLPMGYNSDIVVLNKEQDSSRYCSSEDI